MSYPWAWRRSCAFAFGYHRKEIARTRTGEVVDEKRQISQAFAEQRDVHVYHIEAVVQVITHFRFVGCSESIMSVDVENEGAAETPQHVNEQRLTILGENCDPR